MSIWDAVLYHAPALEKLADDENVPYSYRRRSHAKKGKKWHPLSAWHALSYGNCLTSLINAKSLFEEHRRRTGCVHQATKDWNFLFLHLPTIKFPLLPKKEWFDMNFPGKTREDVMKPFSRVFGFPEVKITSPPRCINLKMFPGCSSPKEGFGGLIEAYRKYYQAKVYTVSGGMRYYYTSPPMWLDRNEIKTVKL